MKKVDIESIALYNKNEDIRNVKACTACGKTRHIREKYYTMAGYPTWHPKGKKNLQRWGDKRYQNVKDNFKLVANIG